MQQLVLCGNPRVSSTPSEARHAAFLAALQYRANQYIVPPEVATFSLRFNQEQYGYAVAAPYGSLRMVEIYDTELALLTQIPYEAIIPDVVGALDSLGALYGRRHTEIVNYASVENYPDILRRRVA